MVNLIATSLSPVTSIRWSEEHMKAVRIEELWKRIASFFSWLVFPSNWSVFQKMNDGWTRRPVNTASVAAKQASKMLVLVWSLGLLFTAIITSTLSRTIKGQEIPLVITVLIKLTSTGTFCVSLSVAISTDNTCKIWLGEVSWYQVESVMELKRSRMLFSCLSCIDVPTVLCFHSKFSHALIYREE